MNLAELRLNRELPDLLITQLDMTMAELGFGQLGGLLVESQLIAEVLYYVARLRGHNLAAPEQARRDMLIKLGVLAGVSAVDLLANLE